MVSGFWTDAGAAAARILISPCKEQAVGGLDLAFGGSRSNTSIYSSGSVGVHQ